MSGPMLKYREPVSSRDILTEAVPRRFITEGSELSLARASLLGVPPSKVEDLLTFFRSYRGGKPNSIIIGGPLGWNWQATLDTTHHGSLAGPANAHRHSDLANIGIDDHHARDHAARHASGQPDAVSLDASQIGTGQFTLSRMPRAASGQFLEGNGVGADPIYNALVATDIPNLDAAKITSGTFSVARGGTGLNTIAAGGILYASALDTLSRIAPSAANQVLRSTAANALEIAALLAADIPNLDTAKITSGTFAVARGGTGLNTIAAGGILYASALDTLSRIAPSAANQVLRSTGANALQIAALVAADIPDLDVAKITTGQFSLSRMPRAASGQFLEGNGVGADPIYNALVAADIPNLDAAKITSGTFPVARGGTGLNTIAAGGILYASALDTLLRIAPSAANQVLRSIGANALEIAALLAADIPNLDTAKITSGRFGMPRMPDGTSGYFLKAQGAGVDPVYAAASAVPSGLIAMWHGLIANIPSGWVICDGNNSTPNLLARFVEGVATAGTNPGDTGGATSKTSASHLHTVPLTPYMSGTLGNYVAWATTPTLNTSSVTVTITDIRPLYYDVAFIMKT